MALLRSVLFSALLAVATTVHGQGQAAAGLLADLKSPAGRVRVRAAEKLAAVREPAVVPALVAALDDGEASVRRAAARSLGEQRNPAAVSPLLKALADPDSNVRFLDHSHIIGSISNGQSNLVEFCSHHSYNLCLLKRK